MSILKKVVIEHLKCVLSTSPTIETLGNNVAFTFPRIYLKLLEIWPPTFSDGHCSVSVYLPNNQPPHQFLNGHLGSLCLNPDEIFEFLKWNIVYQFPPNSHQLIANVIVYQIERIPNGPHINPILRPQVFEEKDVFKMKSTLKKQLIQCQISICPRLDSLTPFIRYTEALKIQRGHEDSEVQENFYLNKENYKGQKPTPITIKESDSYHFKKYFFSRKEPTPIEIQNHQKPPHLRKKRDKILNSLQILEISEISDLSDEENSKEPKVILKPQLQFGARKADTRMRKKWFRKKEVVQVYDPNNNFMLVLSDDEDGMDWRRELKGNS